jgi:hypothetical protein
MELKILITTPKGCASKKEKQIRPFVIGNNKLDIDLYVSPEDDQIVWHAKGDVRECMKAQRNVNLFDTIIKNIFKSKIIQKLVDKKDIPELKDMLQNHTKVEIIKKATEEELQELNSKMSWWDKVKSKFTKKKFNEDI